MNLLHKFLPRVEFDSYEDFKENYRVEIPERFNFAYDVVDEYARLEPDKLALVWCNDNGEERRLTFGDLSALSSQTANAYRKLGIRKGDTVMLILKQRVEAWTCILALCKIGAVCIPASFQLTPKDIVYRCNAAKVKMITAVDDEEVLRHIAGSLEDAGTLACVGVVGERVPEGAKYVDFRELVENEDASYPRPSGTDQDTDSGEPMLMYFSSGTTGMPKMILHDHTLPLGHIVTAKYWQQVEDGGLHLTVCDSGWAKFAWGKIYGQWIAGAVNVAYDTEKFNARGLLETINRLRLTTFCAPPTIYRFLIKEDLSVCDFSSIRHCGIAGEPLNPEVYYRFLEATGLEVREGFGQSETSVLIANFPWLKVKPGSTGKPSPLYNLDIVDENGNSCEDGVVGSIVVRGTDQYHPAGLFREYLEDPDAMARSWKNGMYNTGDMAWRDSDGYYWFEGRNDDVIKCSGYRIGPFEVESALMTHPSVLECAVTAVPDPVRGQVVKATVVLVKDRGYVPGEALKKELQNHVKKVTAPYKYPRVVEFVEELPKTTSGKIRRVEIRDRDEGK